MSYGHMYQLLMVQLFIRKKINRKMKDETLHFSSGLNLLGIFSRLSMVFIHGNLKTE